MKLLYPQLSGLLIFGLGLSCNGEGQARKQPEAKETALMNSAALIRNADSGSFEAETSGRKVLSINVDVAATTLRFVPLDRDFKVKWKKGPSCDRIEVEETASGLDVKHIDQDRSCGGSEVEVLINEKLSTAFNGGAGSLTIQGMDSFLAQAEAVSASVMAGNISSSVEELAISSKWSQMTASYRGDKNSGLKLAVSLGAGNIVFSP